MPKAATTEIKADKPIDLKTAIEMGDLGCALKLLANLETETIEIQTAVQPIRDQVQKEQQELDQKHEKDQKVEKQPSVFAKKAAQELKDLLQELLKVDALSADLQRSDLPLWAALAAKYLVKPEVAESWLLRELKKPAANRLVSEHEIAEFIRLVTAKAEANSYFKELLANFAKEREALTKSVSTEVKSANDRDKKPADWGTKNDIALALHYIAQNVQIKSSTEQKEASTTDSATQNVDSRTSALKAFLDATNPYKCRVDFTLGFIQFLFSPSHQKFIPDELLREAVAKILVSTPLNREQDLFELLGRKLLEIGMDNPTKTEKQQEETEQQMYRVATPTEKQQHSALAILCLLRSGATDLETAKLKISAYASLMQLPSDQTNLLALRQQQFEDTDRNIGLRVIDITRVSQLNPNYEAIARVLNSPLVANLQALAQKNDVIASNELAEIYFAAWQAARQVPGTAESRKAYLEKALEYSINCLQMELSTAQLQEIIDRLSQIKSLLKQESKQKGLGLDLDETKAAESTKATNETPMDPALLQSIALLLGLKPSLAKEENSWSEILPKQKSEAKILSLDELAEDVSQQDEVDEEEATHAIALLRKYFRQKPEKAKESGSKETKEVKAGKVEDKKLEQCFPGLLKFIERHLESCSLEFINTCRENKLITVEKMFFGNLSLRERFFFVEELSEAIDTGDLAEALRIFSGRNVATTLSMIDIIKLAVTPFARLTKVDYKGWTSIQTITFALQYILDQGKLQRSPKSLIITFIAQNAKHDWMLFDTVAESLLTLLFNPDNKKYFTDQDLRAIILQAIKIMNPAKKSAAGIALLKLVEDAQQQLSAETKTSSAKELAELATERLKNKATALACFMLSGMKEDWPKITACYFDIMNVERDRFHTKSNLLSDFDGLTLAEIQRLLDSPEIAEMKGFVNDNSTKPIDKRAIEEELADIHFAAWKASLRELATGKVRNEQSDAYLAKTIESTLKMQGENNQSFLQQIVARLLKINELLTNKPAETKEASLTADATGKPAEVKTAAPLHDTLKAVLPTFITFITAAAATPRTTSLFQILVANSDNCSSQFLAKCVELSLLTILEIQRRCPYLISRFEPQDLIRVVRPDLEVWNLLLYFTTNLASHKIAAEQVLNLYQNQIDAINDHGIGSYEICQLLTPCVTEYATLSPAGRKQLAQWFEHLQTVDERFATNIFPAPSGWETINNNDMRKLAITYALVRLSAQEVLTERDCKLFGKEALRDFDFREAIYRFNLSSPVKAFIALLTRSDVSSENLAEFSKLKTCLPPQLSFMLLKNNLRPDSPFFFNFVTEAGSVENKTEAKREEKNSPNQKLARELIKDETLIFYLKLEQVATICSIASEEPLVTLTQLLKVHKPEYFPLLRRYYLELLGIKTEADQAKYANCKCYKDLIALLKSEGHAEKLAALLAAPPLRSSFNAKELIAVTANQIGTTILLTDSANKEKVSSQIASHADLLVEIFYFSWQASKSKKNGELDYMALLQTIRVVGSIIEIATKFNLLDKCLRVFEIVDVCKKDLDEVLKAKLDPILAKQLEDERLNLAAKNPIAKFVAELPTELPAVLTNKAIYEEMKKLAEQYPNEDLARIGKERLERLGHALKSDRTIDKLLTGGALKKLQLLSKISAAVKDPLANIGLITLKLASATNPDTEIKVVSDLISRETIQASATLGLLGTRNSSSTTTTAVAFGSGVSTGTSDVPNPKGGQETETTSPRY